MFSRKILSAVFAIFLFIPRLSFGATVRLIGESDISIGSGTFTSGKVRNKLNAGSWPFTTSGFTSFDPEDLVDGGFDLTIKPGTLISGGPEVSILRYDTGGDGAISGAELTSLISTIGATQTTLVVDAAVTVSANSTIPSTLTLRFVSPGAFTINNSITLTINSQFPPPFYQIFIYSGVPTLSLAAPVVYPQWWGATGDGTTNDTVAIQNAVNVFKHTGKISATNARGGTLYFPPGRYLITDPILITETSDLKIMGSSYGRLQSHAGGANDDESSSAIYNNCGTNEAAFLVQPTGSNWKTNFIVFQEIGITARSGNPDGIEFDTTNDGMHDIILDRVTIQGGNRQIYITGAEVLFNFMMYNCLLEQAAQVYSTGRANYGIYCDARDESLGIQSLIKDTTIRESQINNIFIDGTAAAGISHLFTIENCTLEATYDGASVFVKSSTTSKLIFIACHWEQIWKNAYWNGTYLQKAVGDSDAAGLLEIGESGVNTALIVTMIQPDANTNYNIETDQEKVLPFIVQYSGRLNIFGGNLLPSRAGAWQQSPFRFDGFEVGVNIFGITVGTLTGVNLFGGSATNISGMSQIANSDYLLRKVDLTTNNGVGTAATNVTVTENGDGHQHVSELSFTNITLGNTGGAANKAFGVLLYTLPAGVQDYKVTSMSAALSTTTVAVQTDAPDVGVGSVIASGAVALLNGTATFEDYLTGQTAADTNGTATVKALAPTAGVGTAILESGDTKTVHLNAADGWAAAADVLGTGTITIEWTSF